MPEATIRFAPLAIKTMIVHTVTYMLMGVLAYLLLDYADVFTRPYFACWFRSLDDPLVMAGVLFQPIRGLLFATVFYPLRGTLFEQQRGAVILWWLLVAVGILSTFGAAPGSVEAMVYTTIPVTWKTYPETVIQAGLLAGVLVYWVNHPRNKWLNWLLGIAFLIAMALPALGLLAP